MVGGILLFASVNVLKAVYQPKVYSDESQSHSIVYLVAEVVYSDTTTPVTKLWKASVSNVDFQGRVFF